jgi:uncharacterized membrane protein YfcA
VTARDRLWALLAGSIAGIAGGFFGVGGGIVLIPILTSFFGLTQHQAHGTSLAVIGFAALVSVTVYAAHSNVAWSTAIVIGLASILTARYGARLATKASPRTLARIFAVFLAVFAVRLLLKQPAGETEAFHHGSVGIVFDLVLGLLVGLFSGFLGIGGGALVVPALVLLVGMNQHLAQGTSLAVILLAAPAGALEHARRGNVIMRLVPMLAIGSAIGGPIASWLAQGLPRATLTRAFALFLLANAVHTWIRAGRARPRPTGEAGATA